MPVHTQPGDLFSIKIWCTDGNQASVNTIWYGVTSVAGGGATDATIAQEFEVLMAPFYKVNLNNNATFNGVQCQIKRAGQDFIAQNSNALAGAGTGGAISLPRQVAALISWKTDKAGQKNRGRTYLPFFSTSSDVGDGTINAGTVANINAVASPLLAIGGVGTGGVTSVIAIVLKHKAPKGVQPLADPITLSQVAPKWATIRKRGSYGRPNTAPL